MNPTTIQTTGFFDPATNLYSLTIAGENLMMTFEYMTEADVRELHSMLSCMLGDVKATDQ